MICFNVPPCTGNEMKYIGEAIAARKICGDGAFTAKCSEWLEKRFHAHKVLLTTSGTTALDMASLLCDLKPGDEVILPSFTFSSSATAFAIYGAKLVFVDVRPDTMNIDETKIEAAITDRTRVILAMHYAGVACEMDAIMDIARRHNLLVVEDAAQGVMSTGTNRSKFYRGQVDKYTWVDIGDSFLPSELNAAYLWAQLEMADEINNDRLASWHRYWDAFQDLAAAGRVTLPTIPADCVHNAHMFYIKCKDLAERTALISFLKERDILAVFHYVPLHSAPAGQRFGRFHGEDKYTTAESDRLVRLPLYYKLTIEDQDCVIKAVRDFYGV